MNSLTNCQNMTDIREAIDYLDNNIVKLISQRAKYVKEAAKFKKDKVAVRDSQRVEKVINSKKELALQYGVSEKLIEKMYRTMIDFFINEELKEWESTQKKDTI